ncbi:prospero homeobox protein 1-like isoform X2 [Denticeps clupeoides]|uniref:Prospero domain-containing protein n=1 Tax=Denticeps clupeoides TaxID=299321 RepID=A0AAY4B4E3_9TELE|nr:prospero homeobox protein 1-like isoform X2 [Denticeps clupeoides]
MPDHDHEFLLNRQTKRRRVDIGVKRTVGTSAASSAVSGPASSFEISASRVAKNAGIFGAMNSHHGSDQDMLDCAGPQFGEGGESKSNVLRKLLKRANSYEDAMVPFPGATIISQLLKNNMAKSGPGAGGESTFPSSAVSSTGSEAPQEDVCSNSSQDSPQECLSPFGRAAACHFDVERLNVNDEHLRAKRARVENIIRGMSHSPSVVVPPGSGGARPAERERERDRDREREREREEEGHGDGPPPPSSPRESFRENKRKQKLPQQQQQSFQQLVSARKEQKQEERRQLKLQLEDMQKQLRQLQEKFFQIYDSTDSEGNDLENDGGNLSEDSGRSDAGIADGDLDGQDSAADRSDNEMSDMDPEHFLDRARAMLREQSLLTEGGKPKREGPMRGKNQGQGPISMRAEGKQLAETLKQELNSAMSQVVDTIVKVFAKPPRPLPQVFPPLPTPQDCFTMSGDNPSVHPASSRLHSFSDVIIPSSMEPFGGVPVPSANDQTEALPLVVRKSSSDHHQSSAVGAHGGHHHPSLHPSSLSGNMGFTPSSFRPPFHFPLIGYPFQGPLGAPAAGYPGKDRASPDSMDLSRETTSLRTKMASNHHLGHRSCSPTHPGSTAEGLSLSLIKSECGDLQDMSDMSPYPGSTIQEGLSPNHLKKAKLMFFYTRYPSSNMLKMFFSDVKFNRCITSQLIKWFSNFREFYYIQMEKFARQAINDGVTTPEEISVSRDCELYRALNMHYNKANDFEVPERFLEVAQITLREFFNAIVAGKDVDPSWKKAIYKVICKLDSEVPEIFKSPNCLQELLHE